MKAINRRQFLQRTAVVAGVPALRSVLSAPAVDAPARPARLGIAGDCFKRRDDVVEMLEYCHQLGAGGIQARVSGWTPDLARRLRARSEKYGMYVEGQISLPKEVGDVAGFESQLATAREAGVTIFRATLLSTRRYETFSSLEAFRHFEELAWKVLTLAEPVARKQGVRLAIENHKDHRADEQAALLKRLGSEHVGVLLDFGNNLSLLEDPMTVVTTLAPLAFSTHLKDAALEECRDGFLLGDVPLGEGFLDLRRIVEICRQANPRIRFLLEMITRDPLPVPCLSEKYWTTFPNVPARELAGMMRLVRDHAPPQPLPRVGEITVAEQAALEEQNLKKCLAYAREHLGL